MRLEILLLGKTKEVYIQQGISDYTKRLRRFIPVELIEIKAKKLSSRSDEEVKTIESGLLDSSVRQGSYRVALDSHGKQFNSREFAVFLSELELRSIQTVCFVIGGHLGLAEEQLDKADTILSLSEMTYTHDLTRLILLEQLYRAYTIKAGTKYHK